MATKSNKIEYTGKRAKLAERLVNPDVSDNVTKVCEDVGVARSTFYKWLKDEDYVSYIQELIDRYTDSELAAVWKALIVKCKTGDVQAIKLYFELKGKYTTVVQNNIKVDNPFSDLTTDDLKKLIDSG